VSFTVSLGLTTRLSGALHHSIATLKSSVYSLTPSSLAYRDADMLDLPIAFPHESPADFRVFITFLETGSLRHPNLRAVTASGFVFRFLAELYAFAGVYKADAFRNAILDAFLLRIMAAPRDLPYEQVQDVYKHTRHSSSLRDLIIDVMVNMGTSKEIRRCMGTLKKDFLLDCLEIAVEDCVVPFQKPKGWLERKADRMCREYHVHSEEELRASAQLEDDEMEVSGEEGGDRDMEELATTGHDEEQDEEQDDEPLDVSDEVKQQMQNLEDLRKLRIHY
jgi:hypothetical protein